MPPDYLTYVSQIPALFHLEDRPFPRRIRGLAIGPSSVVAHRVDERTIDLTMEAGFLSGPLGYLYRKPTEPMHPGLAIEVAGMTATVVESTPAGRPRTVRFRFSTPLDSKTLRWVTFEDGRFEPFQLPPVGERVTLPAAKGPFDALL